MTKKYCYTCGKEVLRIERIWSYDENTGKPQITEDRVCPTNARRIFNHVVTAADAYAEQAG